MRVGDRLVALNGAEIGEGAGASLGEMLSAAGWWGQVSPQRLPRKPYTQFRTGVKSINMTRIETARIEMGPRFATASELAIASRGGPIRNHRFRVSNASRR